MPVQLSLCHTCLETLKTCFPTLRLILFSAQHDRQRIYTASADGEIKIHEIRDQSLNCVYVSENVRSLTGQAVSLRGVKSLVVKGDNLFCGDDGVNIKILDWKKGKSNLALIEDPKTCTTGENSTDLRIIKT